MESEAATAPAVAAVDSKPDPFSDYKRLLSLARRSLEENQRQLAEKESTILRLTEQLEAQTRATSTKQRAGDAAPPSGEPRRALLRVMDGNASWVLVEYEDDDEVHWRYFEDEVELQDHVRRDSGEPLQLPHPCLTPNQSAKIQEEARKAVADITEDFRRFRVKAEISRKQKDAQMKQVAASSIVQQQRRIDEQDVEGELRKARAQADQMGVLRSELAEQEELWRQAYDKLARENEKLRGEGSEAALAAQWRQRYEQCMREKEDVSAKLQMLKSGNGSQRSVDLLKRYQDLKDEYKMYRKKAMEALQEKDVALTQSQAEANMGVRGIARKGGQPDDPRMQYLKNLMLKYLCVDELEVLSPFARARAPLRSNRVSARARNSFPCSQVKEHMERAILMVLGFTEEEKRRIEVRRWSGVLGSGLPAALTVSPCRRRRALHRSNARRPTRRFSRNFWLGGRRSYPTAPSPAGATRRTFSLSTQARAQCEEARCSGISSRDDRPTSRSPRRSRPLERVVSARHRRARRPRCHLREAGRCAGLSFAHRAA